MNVFDIIGPVMIGPSSSHTAGAVRIGLIVHRLLGIHPVKARIILYESFAKTYKGHGTDKALAAGMMGMLPDDERIRDSLILSEKSGLSYTFETSSTKQVHPNTAFITAADSIGNTVALLGSSIGGGNIVIRKINGLDVEFTGKYNTLIISHKDTPGVIASVSNILAVNAINIACMNVYRSSRGGDAMMVIETDQEIDSTLVPLIGNMHGISSIKSVRPI